MSIPKHGVDENYGHDAIWSVAPSRIHGIGVFSNTWIFDGELVGTAIVSKFGLFPNVTFFGSKINHSYRPNVTLRYDYATGAYNIYALRDLQPGTELLADYRDTPFFIAKPDPNWQ